MEGIEIALIGRGELPVWGKVAPLRIGLWTIPRQPIPSRLGFRFTHKAYPVLR